ncbi:MAG: hypothetical protein WCB36_10925 [Burkholderiales bacterium]
MNLIDETALLSRLAGYPLTARCFSKYVSWVVSNQPSDWGKYDLINILNESNFERLAMLESQLSESNTVLGSSQEGFAKQFGFNDDLLSVEPEKIHDILAEPLFILDLSQLGFTKISKLPPYISTKCENIPNADFFACNGSSKYVIELKTIRMENEPKPVIGQPTGNALIPSWWVEMFRNNIDTKIKDKKKRVLKQLANAKKHYNADKTMLVFYTRRLGPSTLMEKENYVAELRRLVDCYPEVDYFCCKDFFGDVTLCPDL